jgi:hypothetical protein
MPRTKRIHIARDRMQAGEPCIAIDDGRAAADFANYVEIQGASRVIFDPLGMPAGGVRRPIKVWVETEAELFVDREQIHHRREPRRLG